MKNNRGDIDRLAHKVYHQHSKYKKLVHDARKSELAFIMTVTQQKEEIHQLVPDLDVLKG